MANSNAPSGLKPVRHLAGGSTARADAFVGGIVSAMAQSIYRGDPVTLLSTGKIQPAAAGDVIYGVFWGVQYNDSTGKPTWSNYWPASTTATKIVAYVYRDPNLVFEVQCNSNFTVAHIGENCDIAYTSGTGIGYSRVQAVSSFDSSTRQLRVLDLVRRADNVEGTNAKIEVMINEHHLNSAVGV